MKIANIDAANLLGRMNRAPTKREGEVTDEQQILLLAEQGDVTSQIFLGWAYDRGGEFHHSEQKAEFWLRKATDAGSINAERRLARFLFERNRNEAINVANRLVEKGDFYGHFVLGHAYTRGRCGVDLSMESGISHFKKGYEMGHLVSEVLYLRNRYRWPYVNPRSAPRLLVLAKAIFITLLRDRNSLAVYR